MRGLFWLAMGLVTGCESVEPSGALFEPVVEPTPAPASPEAVPVPAGGFDFDADAPLPAPAGGSEDLEPGDLAAGLGLGPVDLTVPAPAPAAVAPAPMPGWNPQAPLDGSWGVRLVSTVPDAQPPRAILGMPDGTETVVTPGTLLPGAGIVVLAIGRDIVQVAEIVPAGDHARVETHILEPMFRQGMTPR